MAVKTVKVTLELEIDVGDIKEQHFVPDTQRQLFCNMQSADKKTTCLVQRIHDGTIFELNTMRVDGGLINTTVARVSMQPWLTTVFDALKEDIKHQRNSRTLRLDS